MGLCDGRRRTLRGFRGVASRACVGWGGGSGWGGGGAAVVLIRDNCGAGALALAGEACLPNGESKADRPATEADQIGTASQHIPRPMYPKFGSRAHAAVSRKCGQRRKSGAWASSSNLISSYSGLTVADVSFERSRDASHQLSGKVAFARRGLGSAALTIDHSS